MKKWIWILILFLGIASQCFADQDSRIAYITAKKALLHGTGTTSSTYKIQKSSTPSSIGSDVCTGDCAPPGVGLDDMTPSGTFNGLATTNYCVKINSAAVPDTWSYYHDLTCTGSVIAGPTNISVGAMTLDEGVTITFAATTGHAANDIYVFTATTTDSDSCLYLGDDGSDTAHAICWDDGLSGWTFHSGAKDSAGVNSVSLGLQSLGHYNTTGDYNVTIGKRAGEKNTVGNNNVYLGTSAGRTAMKAGGGVIIGSAAGRDLTNGDYNIYLGYQAGLTNTVPTYNIGIGVAANSIGLGGTHNISIGNLAGAALGPASSYSVFIGESSGKLSTSLNGTTCFGSFSCDEADIGDFNTAMGYDALSHGTGSGNTTIGYDGLYSLSIGENNTGLGRNAGLSATTGSGGVYLGSNAGRYVTTQSNEFFLNNQDRTTYAGDQTLSLLYGTFAATAGAQQLTVNASLRRLTQAGITAYATGGQANAVQIAADIAEISVCATAADSVKLPAAIAGLQVTVINHGVAAADVFPASGDVINEAAADAAKSLGVNASFLCTAYNAVNWECLLLGR